MDSYLYFPHLAYISPMSAIFESDKPKIRVLRVMARFNLGGPALQISSLMEFLNPQLFEQRLMVGYCAQDEIDYSEVQKLNFKIYRNKYMGRRVNFSSDFLALISMIKALYEFRPDIVHSHTAKAGVICRVARLLYFRRLHLVHTYHGHLLYGYFGKFQTRLVIFLEKSLAVITTKLVTVGSRVKEELILAGVAKRDKFLVIPPGITFKLTVASSLDFENKSLVRIGFVGRITQIKRPDKFLEIVVRLKEINANVSVSVAGDGSQLQEMKIIAQTRNLDIAFLGWVPDVEDLFKELDLIILTSDNEGTPISILQAAAQGCIALARDVGSVEDVLKDKETGFICNDTQSFVEKITYLANNPQVLRQMKQKAQAFALENFTGENLAKNHERLYLSIMRS